MVTTVAAPPSHPAPSLKRRLKELDGIRGIAAMMVVLSHTTLVVLPGGFVGVDVFFVLSGFIITGLLLDEVRAVGRVRLARFWARRATRLLPAALLVIVVVCIMTILFDSYTTRQETFGDARAGALYVENWHLIATGADYFGESLAPSRLRHYWSLAVEEQFYVVWPLLLMALALRARWARPGAVKAYRLLIPMGLLAAASYLAALHFDDGTGLQAYMGTLTRVWQLLLGAAIAVCWRQASRWSGPRRSDALMVLGIVLLVVACWYASAVTFLPYGAVLAAGGAAALIAGLVDPGPQGVRLFGSPPLQFLGKVSYSIYLWHWPVILYAALIVDHRWSPFVLTVFEVTLTIVLAALTLKFVETPLRHVKLRELRPALTVAIAVVVSICVAFGASALARADTRHVATSTGIDLVAVSKDKSVHACPNEPHPCVRHTGTSGLVVATVGDSTMQHYDPALRKLATKDDFTYVQAAIGGCAVSHKFLATGVDALHKQSNYECRDWIPGAYQELLTKYDPDVILVTSSNERAPFIGSDGSVLKAGSPEHIAQTKASLAASLRLLTSKGATVVLVDQLPRGNGTDCLADRSQAACTTKAADDASTLQYNAIYREVGATIPHVKAVSTIDEVCPGGLCPPVVDGVFVRYDGGHFTGSFSRKIAAPLAADLRRVGVDLTRS